MVALPVFATCIADSGDCIVQPGFGLRVWSGERNRVKEMGPVAFLRDRSPSMRCRRIGKRRDCRRFPIKSQVYATRVFEPLREMIRAADVTAPAARKGKNVSRSEQVIKRQ
jgi:hypothetical protein